MDEWLLPYDADSLGQCLVIGIARATLQRHKSSLLKLSVLCSMW